SARAACRWLRARPTGLVTARRPGVVTGPALVGDCSLFGTGYGDGPGGVTASARRHLTPSEQPANRCTPPHQVPAHRAGFRGRVRRGARRAAGRPPPRVQTGHLGHLGHLPRRAPAPGPPEQASGAGAASGGAVAVTTLLKWGRVPEGRRGAAARVDP